jgi:hypothetical protein
LTRHESQVRSNLPARLEARRIADGQDVGERDEWAHAWDLLENLSYRVSKANQLFNTVVHLGNLARELSNGGQQRLESNTQLVW